MGKITVKKRIWLYLGFLVLLRDSEGILYNNLNHTLIYAKGRVSSASQKSSLSYRNPFASLLPRRHKKNIRKIPKKKAEPKLSIKELGINIEGILWGGNHPQAIINGEVYDVGEKLENKNMKIIGIKKGEVEILYRGEIYVLGMETKIKR
ncbi:MAG: hypothetical protein B6D56_01935 [Candidatus Omnitrophica bacterium 4484_70.1]|nr:MAG: hypothetical protein B6D56_01935 [Candidatus Omnitrophica bacterium 4484_70.1]